MSEWGGHALSLDVWTSDLQSVVAAAAVDGPMALLGISQGAATCIRFATRFPERVDRLVLYGGYARGALRHSSPQSAAFRRAMTDLASVGWGNDNATFRQVFTSRFIPGGCPAQVQWFNDLCRKTTTGDVVAALLEARAIVDVTEELDLVRVPTLVVHARDDEVIPVGEGRLLATAIPGAEFVEVDSRNHILLEDEPAWRRFCDAVASFLPLAPAADASVFESLSPRERQVLALITDGLSNLEIAARLAISEKTVRNHASNVFDKLGVWSRAQAIVFARDHGFGEGGR